MGMHLLVFFFVTCFTIPCPSSLASPEEPPRTSQPGFRVQDLPQGNLSSFQPPPPFQLQSEKGTEYKIVKKKDGYKKKFLVKEEGQEGLSTSIPSSLSEELDRILLNATRVAYRSKRQSDATTEVVGLRLDSETNDRTAQILKRGARAVARGRARRSISFNWEKMLELGPKSFFRIRRRLGVPKYGPPAYHPAPPLVHVYTTPAITYGWGIVQHAPPPPPPPPVILTRQEPAFPTMTLRIWNAINFNYQLARRFLLSDAVQSDRESMKIIATNPRGVTCEDVCDPHGNGFGTIGICTPKFCKCDFHSWLFTRYDCPKNCVFDPIRLVCDYPTNVFLCNDDNFYDDDYSNQENQVQYSYGWSSGGYAKKK